MSYAEEMFRWAGEGYRGDALHSIVDHGILPLGDEEEEASGEFTELLSEANDARYVSGNQLLPTEPPQPTTDPNID